LLCPTGPKGKGTMKFTIYVPLVPKMRHIKFEKNWSSGYQEVKKCSNVWPRPGGKTSTLRIMKFTILVEAFLLYIPMPLVFLTYMKFQRRFFFKLVNFDTFCPARQSPGGKKPEIHNLCCPCPKDASYQIRKELEQWLSRRT
jgi:hypothetical protein